MRLTALLLCLATPAAAMTDIEETEAVMMLSTLIGSEQACGLTYDQAAIAAWITTNVPPDRLNFAGALQLITQGQQAQVDLMTGSAKTAHCTTVAQSARHLGFTK
jgi:hypothetical protein